MKAVTAAFNQEKALVGAFSVITNLRMELFEALDDTRCAGRLRGADVRGGQAARHRHLLQVRPAARESSVLSQQDQAHFYKLYAT